MIIKSIKVSNRFQKVSFCLVIIKVLFLNLPFYGQAQTNDAPEIKYPKALREDITVEHVVSIGPQAVRILQHPVSKEIYYNTFDGDVFKIKDLNNNPTPEKIFSAADHGIVRLQGAVFLGNNLYLCGNINVNNNKGTKGRMVKYNLASSGRHTLTEVFNTEEVGSTKTVFDHGFNGLAISPDNKYIFVNSGARTDHGEVQDNDGEYPNSRDEPLTACILRIPVDAENLLLVNDKEKLIEGGYLFATGIRNAYDLAFDPNGNLFAVSNSGDYDHPEDMFWIREGQHYGFPWIMGGIENPQQYPDWQPDPDTDPFLNRFSHSWAVRYFRNDPDFPAKPKDVEFTPAVQNSGPDANEYRDRATGKIMDADTTGATVGTFTAHSSPLGLIFDNKKILSNDFNGDGFVIRYSLGARSSLMKPFTNEGADLLHLKLIYDKKTDNYKVKTTSIVNGFSSPTDAELVENSVYIIEYGGRTGGNIWKINLPEKSKEEKAKNKR